MRGRGDVKDLRTCGGGQIAREFAIVCYDGAPRRRGNRHRRLSCIKDFGVCQYGERRPVRNAELPIYVVQVDLHRIGSVTGKSVWE